MERMRLSRPSWPLKCLVRKALRFQAWTIGRVKPIACAILALTVAALSGVAYAQETAGVMPKGVFRARVIGISASNVFSKFNQNGEAEGLMHPLNRSLSVSDLMASSADLALLASVLEDLEPGATDRIFQADLFADAAVNAQQVYPVLEYGLTETVTLAFKFAYARHDVRASFRAETQNNLAYFQDLAKGLAPVEAGLSQLAEQLPTTTTFAEEIFTSKGYEVPQNFSYSGTGDFALIGKYRWLETEKHWNAVMVGLNLPTSSAPRRQENLLWTGTGDNSFDLEVKVFHEYFVLPQLSVVGMLAGMIQLPDQETWSTPPIGFTDGLVDLNELQYRENLRRNLGDSVTTHLGVNWRFYRRIFTLGVAHEYFKKASDSFQGDRGLDYASLSKGTDKESHNVSASLSVSSVPLFLEGEVAVPAEIRVSYWNTVAGVNESNKQYLRLELMTFFR